MATNERLPEEIKRKAVELECRLENTELAKKTREWFIEEFKWLALSGNTDELLQILEEAEEQTRVLEEQFPKRRRYQ